MGLRALERYPYAPVGVWRYWAGRAGGALNRRHEAIGDSETLGADRQVIVWLRASEV